MDDARLAQGLAKRSVARHPSKDHAHWFIRRRVVVPGGRDITDTEFVPKVGVLTDKEGALYGQKVQTGDRKLTIDGTVEIDTGLTLVTKNDAGEQQQQWNVYYVAPWEMNGVAVERFVFARPLNKVDS